MAGHLEQILLELVVSNRKMDLCACLGDMNCHSQVQERQVITLNLVKETKEKVKKGHVHKNFYFQACDLFIRQSVEPSQKVLNTWMRGAKAQVAGKNIEFSKLVDWCQHEHSKKRRDELEKEARSLCRFLATFSQATWEATFETVTDVLGYESYLAFLMEKKGHQISTALPKVEGFLNAGQDIYQALIEDWFQSLPEPVGKGDRSRFDAIYLLGMRYMDHLYSECWKGDKGIFNTMKYFDFCLSKPKRPTLHVVDASFAQSICIPVKIPHEIHVVSSSLSGWIDLEGLFHELGHAFFFLNTDPDLPVAQKDFFVDFALSETYAFLFQLICLSEAFLEDFMGLRQKEAKLLSLLQKAKFLALARRYGAKSIIEYENFAHPDPVSNQDRYARLMQKFTGFRYDKETYLFDLMPDLYSLDYFVAFVGACLINEYLENRFGLRWFREHEAFSLLKGWARRGNSLDLFAFLNGNLSLGFDYECISRYFPHNNVFHNIDVKKMAQMV